MALFTKKQNNTASVQSGVKPQVQHASLHQTSVVLRPRITEKAFRIASDNQYVFDIAIKTSKQEAVKQIAKLYNVTIVRSQIVRGIGVKPSLQGKRGGRTVSKKIVVTVAKGQKIDMTGNA